MITERMRQLAGVQINEAEFDAPKITSDMAKQIGDELGVDWDKVDLEELRMGMEVELEHGSLFNKQTDVDTDLIGTDPTKAAQVAIAHLEELPDYYTRLAKMEEGTKLMKKVKKGERFVVPGSNREVEVLKVFRSPRGNKAIEVKDLDTGETLTLYPTATTVNMV